MSRSTVDIARMTPRARAIWLEAWEAGYLTRAAEAPDPETFWRGVEFQRAYEDHARGIAAWLTSCPPYAVLAERRGDHDRAEAQRRTLAERGIWPVGVASC